MSTTPISKSWALAGRLNRPPPQAMDSMMERCGSRGAAPPPGGGTAAAAGGPSNRLLSSQAVAVRPGPSGRATACVWWWECGMGCVSTCAAAQPCPAGLVGMLCCGCALAHSQGCRKRLGPNACSRKSPNHAVAQTHHTHSGLADAASPRLKKTTRPSTCLSACPLTCCAACAHTAQGALCSFILRCRWRPPPGRLEGGHAQPAHRAPRGACCRRHPAAVTTRGAQRHYGTAPGVPAQLGCQAAVLLLCSRGGVQDIRKDSCWQLFGVVHTQPGMHHKACLLCNAVLAAATMQLPVTPAPLVAHRNHAAPA